MSTIHTKVAAVLKFMDAVLEKSVVWGGIHIQISQQNKFIWKSADCVVILEQEGVACLDISIWGGIYQDMQMHTELSDVKTAQVHTVWMTPSRRYPFTAEMTVIRGNCKADELYALRKLENTRCKLMETTQAGDESIRIWGFDGNAENRMLALCDGNQMELLTIAGRVQDMEYGYLTKNCLTRSFHKGNTKIYTASRINTDSDGGFAMAYLNVAQSGEQIQFVWEGMVEPFCLDIHEGQEYQVDLDDR